MAQIAFLNEKAYPQGAIAPRDAKPVLDTFVDLMVALRKAQPRASLVSDVGLLGLSIGNEYPVSRWLNETDRERRRFLLSLGQIAPFKTFVQAQPNDGEVEVREYTFEGAPFDGLSVEGVGLADMFDGLAVSFAYASAWRLRNVPVCVRQLTDDGEDTWRVDVPHAVTLADINHHIDRLRDVAQRDVRTPEAFWLERGDYLPNLRFLPRVEADLLGLQPYAFLQVVAWLFRLDRCLIGWNPAQRPVPPFPPHTTGEGEQRKRLCWFADGENQRCFDLHGRFTPGAGRIHFRVAGDERKAVVAYIGVKLE